MEGGRAQIFELFLPPMEVETASRVDALDEPISETPPLASRCRVYGEGLREGVASRCVRPLLTPWHPPMRAALPCTLVVDLPCTWAFPSVLTALVRP